MRVNAGQRNVRGHARHEQQREGVEDARAQLGDLQGIGERGKHGKRQPTMAWPPAFSILALADSENFAAVTLKARLSSPSPRILTVFSPPRIRPLAASTSAVTSVTLVSSDARSPTLRIAISVR